MRIRVSNIHDILTRGISDMSLFNFITDNISLGDLMCEALQVIRTNDDSMTFIRGITILMNARFTEPDCLTYDQEALNNTLQEFYDSVVLWVNTSSVRLLLNGLSVIDIKFVFDNIDLSCVQPSDGV